MKRILILCLALAASPARAANTPVIADDTTGVVYRPTNLQVSSPLLPPAHPGITLNGTTSARIYGACPSVGTLPFTLVGSFLVPTANPSAVNGLMALSSSATTTAQNNSLEVSIKTNGDLLVTFNDTAGSAKRDVVVSGFRSTFSGRQVQIAVARDVSTGLAVYINDALATTSETVTGSPASWAAGSITSTYLDVGFTSSSTVYSGSIYGVSLYTVTLSASEVATLFNHGRSGIPAPAYRWASNTSVVPTGYAYSYGASDGTTATSGNDYTPSTSLTSVSGTRTGGAGSYVLRITTTNNGAAYCDIYDSKIGPGSGSGAVGQKMRLQFWARASSSFSIIGLNYQGAFGGGTKSTGFAPSFTTSWQFYDCVLTFTAPGASVLRFSFNNSNVTGDWVEIDDLFAAPAGAVGAWACDEGVGFEAQDSSPSHNHLTITTAGTGHEIVKQRGTLRFTTTGTSAVRLLGQQALPANARITSWTIDSTGSTAVNLGTTSGGTDIANAASLSTGLNDVTLSTRFSSTNDLYCTSSSSVTLQHTITYEIVD